MPIALLKSLNPHRIILPYQHLVNDEQVAHIKHLYPFKGTKAFAKDIDYLLKHFKPLSVEDILQHINAGTPLPQNGFLLSFDDGLREVKTHIAPLLEQKGVPAAFFINTAFLDNKELFYNMKVSLLIESMVKQQVSPAQLERMAEIMGLPGRVSRGELQQRIRQITYSNKQLADELGEVAGLDFQSFLREKQPFLNSDEVQTLVDKGFAIGGHSIDHPYYTSLTLEQQIQQTLGSVNPLVERFQLPYKIFAFPHYDTGVSKAFFDAMLHVPNPPLDLIFGTSNHKQDISPRILHRFNCERPAIDIQSAVKGILAYTIGNTYRGKQIVHRS